MAGDGASHGDVRRFTVTDLAHGDDVRVLTKDGAEAVGKGHAGLFIDLDLVDAVHVVFHGVLQSDQVHVVLVQVVDHGVHGGGFTGTGGAHDQQHAAAAMEHMLVFLQIAAGKPDGILGELLAGFIQQTCHDLLAVNGGQRGDTEVDVLVLHLHVEAPILGDAVLRDVQAAHDLDTGNDAALQIAGDRHDIAHQAVDPHADLQLILPGLQMDIAGALGDGTLDDGVHQPDGGSVADGVVPQLIGDESGVGNAHILGCGGFPLHLLNGLGGAFVAVKHLDGALHGGGRRHHGHDLLADSLANFLDRIEVHGVAHGQIKLILHRAHGNDLILLRNILRQSLCQLRGDIDLRQVHKFDAQLHLQGFDELFLRDDIVGDQHGAEALFGALLQGKPACKFLF